MQRSPFLVFCREVYVLNCYSSTGLKNCLLVYTFKKSFYLHAFISIYVIIITLTRKGSTRKYGQRYFLFLIIINTLEPVCVLGVQPHSLELPFSPSFAAALSSALPHCFSPPLSYGFCAVLYVLFRVWGLWPCPLYSSLPHILHWLQLMLFQSLVLPIDHTYI